MEPQGKTLAILNKNTVDVCQTPLTRFQTPQVDKVVGIFKSTDDPDRPMSLSPVPGMSSCYVTSPCTSPLPSLTGDAPQDLAINELSFGMQQSQGADETADPVEVRMD